jgi:hypothetical protein
MGYRYCSHNQDINRCPHPTCKHHDNRPLVQQLFGRGGSNSVLAARIARLQPELYRKTQEEGRALGLLPKLNIPRCLQDPE